MRTYGYCDSCHKIKQVRVSQQSLVMLAVRHGNGVPQGTCSDCEDAQMKPRSRP